jgi:AcrR family transcriptional regulator
MAQTHRIPEHERSIRSLARLLDAAERLLERAHFDDISIADIVKEAGTSVGNFYGRFASKDALLDALHERYQNDRNLLWQRFFDNNESVDVPLAMRIESLVRTTIRNYRSRAGVFRTLVSRQWRNPEALNAESKELLGGLYKNAAAYLLKRRQEIRRTNPERAVEIGLAAVVAACRENIVMRPKAMPASLKIGDEELAQELSRMLHAYLTAPPAKSKARA